MELKKEFAALCAITVSVLAPAAHAEPEPLCALAPEEFRLEGAAARECAKSSVSDAKDGKFPRTLIVELSAKPAHPWDAQLTRRPGCPIAKGESYEIRLWLRSPMKDKCALAGVGLLKGSPPWTPLASSVVEIGSEWQRISVPFHAAEGFESGAWLLTVDLGRQAQSVELGPGDLLRLPPRQTPPVEGRDGKLLQGGASLIPSAGLAACQKWGKGWASYANAQTLQVAGMPFETATRIAVSADSKNPWDVQTGFKNETPIHDSDIMLGVFWARAAKPMRRESEDSDIQFFIQRNGKPWTVFYKEKLAVSLKWRQFFVPVRMLQGMRAEGKRLYNPGELAFGFNLGYQPQEVEKIGRASCRERV